MQGDCSIRIEGLGFSAGEIAACAARQGLLSIELELSGEATCDCPKCRINPQPVLTQQEIRSLIDQAQQLGCRRVILIGESRPHDRRRRPVSCETLQSLVDEINQRQTQIELITEGSEINGDFAASLFNHRIDVAVDFESSATIDRLRKAGYARGGSPRLSARLFATEKNLRLIPAIWRSLRSIGVTPHLQTVTPDQTPGQVTPDSQSIRQLYEQLERIDREEFDITWQNPPELTGRSCKRHLFAVHVSACGSVFACRGIDIPLGTIRTEPLREIVTRSEVLEDLRAYHEKVKEPCRTCTKTVDCYGCRGTAHQLTGDYLAGDSLCWKADSVPIQILPVNVAGLIPHGPAIRMVDQLVRVGEREFTTRFSVPIDSPFLDEDGILDELAYVEMIAQSFAASHCFHLTPEQVAVHKGLLLGVTNLVISGFARGGDKLTIELKKVTRFGDFGIVEGHVHQNDRSLIASGQVKVWRPAEGALPNA